MRLEDTIRNVLNKVGSELDGEWSVESVSRLAGYSPYHFHRIFKGLTGESLMGCLTRLRMEKAAFHLLRTEKSLAEIAVLSGYGSVESFCRRFKKSYQKTPSEFRQEYAEAWKLSGAYHYGQDRLLEHSRPTQNWPVSIRELGEYKVYSRTVLGPYLEAVSVWSELLNQSGGQLDLDSVTKIGICHDDPDLTEASHLRYEACLVVEDSIRCPANFEERTIHGGRYAVWTHHGGYEELEDVYRRLLGEWLPNSGEKILDLPCLEIYVRTPFDEPSPQHFETLVCLALQ